MYNPYTLTDKTILVTGASSGIGRAVAIECALMGAKLIITARNVVRLQDTLHQLVGEDHIAIIADLTNYQDLENLVCSLPKIDGCVNNAGIVHPLMLQLSEKKDIDEVIQLNALAPMYLTQQLVQQKKLTKNASLLFISSISGVYCGYIGGTAYGASKGALQGFVKATALELAGRGIRVNTINPGMVDTGLLNDSVISNEQLDEDKKRYPLKRYGQPQEVAQAVIYFLSDASRWVTGTSFLIDGGYTLQ